MKSRFFHILSLMLCLGVLSCDKTPQGEGPEYPQPSEQSPEQIFWNVVGQLVGMDKVTPDYQGKSFEPIIGEEIEPGVRVVSVNSLAAAVARFNMLTEAGITEETPSHTWNDPNVGSLTWALGDQSTAWGTVDVSIPAVTGLTRIIYRSPDQGDTNGGVQGGARAYYRFGDVISRTRPASEKGGNTFPAITEYWVCVRPAFDPEGKGDSHWVSLSPLPRENVWPYCEEKYNYGPYVGSNGNSYGVPFSLGKDTEWLQDLNEVFYAITQPDEWYSNVTNYAKENWRGAPTELPIFNDFHVSKANFHNSFFWQNVKRAWLQKGLFEKILGEEDGGVRHDASWVATRVVNGGEGLKYLYKGYSWWVSTSNNLDLYQAWYKSVSDSRHLQLNMHAATYKTITRQVTNPRNTSDAATNIPFNVRTECSEQKPFVINEKFFGDKEPRFICRYATGEELSSSGNYEPRFAIPGFKTVYRYYDEFEKGSSDLDKPEVTDARGDGYVGRAHYRWGNVYKDEKGAKWFVFNQAGYDTGLTGGDFDKMNERSPYTELVSFDNVGFDVPQEPTSKQRITNLPTRDQAIRAFMFLYIMYNQTHDMDTDEKMDNNQGYGFTAKNLIQAAQFDPRKMMQTIFMPNRSSAVACSIGYRGDANEVEQPLLRCVVNTKLLNDNSNKFFFWTRYPAAPDNTTAMVTQFSNSPIHLQDIASSTAVNTYAKDYYVVCPLARVSDPASDEATARTPRSTPDFSARDITYYFYNMTTWNNRTDWTAFTDMWYEPILLFRYTRVMDRGDDNFSTTTTDGHTLTLVKERDWSIYGSRDATYDELKGFAEHVWASIEDNLYLNGQPYQMLKWSELKDNE